MSADREATRIVRSWLEEGVTALPDRVLDAVLDQIPATPQRRSWWPTRRIAHVNRLVLAAAATAAVVVVAVLGYDLLPGASGPGRPPSTTTGPSPSPAPLAVGSFVSHGAQVELDATGDGSNVTGSMTVADLPGSERGSFTIDLACTRTTDSGLVVIGGPVTDSTNSDDVAPKGSNVAIVIERGSPVKAVFWFEHPEPHETSCPTFLDSIPDAGDPGFDPSWLEPISGAIELRP